MKVFENILSQKYPLIMGILNVTPDSFFDGGNYNSLDKALKQAEKLILEGADIIDIGGESTRPNAKIISIAEELDRVIPIIEKIKQNFDIQISIDTSKAEVMDAAINSGANIINDVYALQNPGALETAARLNVPVCIMHMQGNPQNMQNNPSYKDPVQDVVAFLKARTDSCIAHGILKGNLMIDPGFGFGKSLEHNLALLKDLGSIVELGFPVLVGLSNKSMIGKLLDLPEDERLFGSIAANIMAYLNGASIIRVHNVRPTVEAIKVVTATIAG